MTSALQHAVCFLFCLRERISGRFFLVDSGAEMCVIPPTPTHAEKRHPQPGSTSSWQKETNDPTNGRRSLTLVLGLRKTFRWIFFKLSSSTWPAQSSVQISSHISIWTSVCTTNAPLTAVLLSLSTGHPPICLPFVSGASCHLRDSRLFLKNFQDATP